MSKIVAVPNVGNVEFPDTMSDDDIATAIKQQMAGKQPEPKPQPYNAAGENFDPNARGDEGKTGVDAATGVVKQIGKGMHQAAIGAGKGVIGTGYHVAKLLGLVKENPDFEAALQDQNAFQTTGHVAEQVGEFAGAEGAANAALKATGAAAKIATAPKAVRLAAEVAKGAAVGGAVTKAQGGSGTAGAVAGGAAPLVGAALEPLANSLAESAAKSYNRTLGATKRTMKNVADKVVRGYTVAGEDVPGLVDRGVVAWTRKGLSTKAAEEVSNLGDQIDNLWSNLPKDEKVPTQPIVDAIDQAKTKFVQQGPAKQVTVSLGDVQPHETPISIDPVKQTAVVSRSAKAVVEPGAVKNLDRVKKLVTTLTDDNGEANVHQLREVKQVMDDVVAGKGGYAGAQLSLSDHAGILARRKAANAIRDVLADAHPDIAAVNRQYHFWSQTEEVLKETLSRTSSQSQPMGQQIARVAGAAAGAAGGPAKAILTGEAAGLFRKLTTSAAWNTTSAVAKDRLAKVIASGSTSAATNLMKNMLQTGVSRATQ